MESSVSGRMEDSPTFEGIQRFRTMEQRDIAAANNCFPEPPPAEF